MKKSAEQMLHACGLNDMDRALIRLYGLHGCAKAAEIADWFAAVDFEKLSPQCVCMAAVMCAENNYRDAPFADPHDQRSEMNRRTKNAGMGFYTNALCGIYTGVLGVTDGYKKVEKGVVEGYEKNEDAFIDRFLTREGETVEDARKRLKGKTRG